MQFVIGSRLYAVTCAVILAGAGAPAASAAALPDPVAAGGDYALQRVGRGQLRWFGRAVYDASLWTPAGRFTGYDPGQPVALSLWYERSFSRADLLRITGTAWRLLDAGTPRQRAAWLEELSTVWGDVEPGHNLTAVVLPGAATHFYDHQRLRGTIDDPEFGPAYLSIWLDARTVVGDLRLALLGQQ